MPTLIIRNVPEKVCSRIKDRAKEHRRSMAMEALVMLERELDFFDVRPLDIKNRPPRTKFLKPYRLTDENIEAAINEGRK